MCYTRAYSNLTDLVEGALRHYIKSYEALNDVK
jgi:hypothetical protein